MSCVKLYLLVYMLHSLLGRISASLLSKASGSIKEVSVGGLKWGQSDIRSA